MLGQVLSHGDAGGGEVLVITSAQAGPFQVAKKDTALLFFLSLFWC